MKKIFLLVVILFSSLFSLGQITSQSAPVTLTTAAQTPFVINLIGSNTLFVTLQWNVIGTISGCTIRVDSSADSVTWNNGDIITNQTCTSNGSVLSTSHTVNYVRINPNATITGTGSIVFTLTGTNSNTTSVAAVVTQPNGANLNVNVGNNQSSAVGALTTSSSATCTGANLANGVYFATSGAGSMQGAGVVTITVTGANTGALGFYYSIDGVNVIAVPSGVVFPIGTGASVTTTSANGQFRADTRGFANFGMCGTAVTGTATINMLASLPSNDNVNLQNVGGTAVSTLVGPGSTQVIPVQILPVNTSGATQALTQVKFTTNAGTVAGAVIKASAGNFYGFTVNNPNASICVLEIFNATTGQAPGTAIANIPIPATASYSFVLIPYSENFATGIAFTGATATDGATGCTSAMTGTAWIR